MIGARDVDRARRVYWARRLRPIRLDEGPIDGQMRRRVGVLAVGSGLLVAMGCFVTLIFAGFGRWEIGLLVDAVAIAPLLGWIWGDFWRLRRSVVRFASEERE